ncbi:MAG TPA: ribonuclease, partial [Syntrophobacteraceae bacterium]|nr:ribonuclease [Syntrophobacteraceae bacterium]
KDLAQVRGTFSIEVANYLLNQKRNELKRLEERYGTSIWIEGSPILLPHEGQIEFVSRDGAH